MLEYKYISFPIKKTFTSKKSKEQELLELEQLTNQYADQGWKLIQVFSPLGEGNVLPDNYVLIMAREKI